MNDSTQFVFRVPASFIRETTEAARSRGLSRSEYARRAIEEANAKARADRIAALSRRLSADTAAEADALDGTVSDGLQ